MMVLWIACGADELKGALGVLVGSGVFEGGTNEKLVADGCRVMVGASVGVSVYVEEGGRPGGSELNGSDRAGREKKRRGYLGLQRVQGRGGVYKYEHKISANPQSGKQHKNAEHIPNIQSGSRTFRGFIVEVKIIHRVTPKSGLGMQNQ